MTRQVLAAVAVACFAASVLLYAAWRADLVDGDE